MILSISLYAVFILPMRLNNYSSIDRPAKIFAASRKAQVTPLLSYFTNGRFEVHSNPNILASTLFVLFCGEAGIETESEIECKAD